MDYIIPSLVDLLAPLRHCFRQEAFANFQHILVAWLLGPGPRTLTEVWQASSLAGRKHHDAIYPLFGTAVWDWDELGTILGLYILTHLVPSGYVGVVVDDTLGHKRGAKVAFGGFFLDAVLSSKRRKVFSFGVNCVVLGLVMGFPFRPDRQGVTFAGQTKKVLRLQIREGVLWYTGCKTDPVPVVRVRDLSEAWQDTARVCTKVGLTAQEVIQGYARRWSVEVMFHDSKHYRGLQDPQVGCEQSVQRVHPMAWFSYSVTLLWYALNGDEHETLTRERPWYKREQEQGGALTQVLGTLRLALLRGRYFGAVTDATVAPPSPEILLHLLHCLATVR